MKFHIFAFFAVIILLSSFLTASAQVDSVIGQVTSSANQSYAGGISGDGRFIVFESAGDLATVNPRNADGNIEVFLFDYAQRRIFQITDTKSLLTNTANAPTFNNIKVDITNTRPVISNQPDANGNYWIALSSNATCAYPGNPAATPATPAISSVTNPGNFDANAPFEPAPNPSDPPVNKCSVTSGTTTTNNLVNDGNTELWLFKVPTFTPVADLSAGEEIPLTDLSTGTFTRLTNTLPSRLPVPGSTTTLAIIADDNHDASIDETGSAVSFTSNRDLVPCGGTASATCGNAFPSFDNDEIYVYINSSTPILKQVTATSRGTVSNPLYNANSTITILTEGGWRIALVGNANNPIAGMTGGTNADGNEEIFFTNIDSAGTIGTKKQVTATTRTNVGDVVNIFNFGRRMSRGGRFIALDSYADLAPASGTPGANLAGFATFIYDTTTSTFRQIGVRSDADSAASGGDVQRFPGFTDYDASGNPLTLVLETRMNIKPDGTIPTTSSEGLNDVTARPAQVYSYPLTGAAPIFTRLTKLPTPSFFLASIQPIPSDSRRRMTFNLAQTEVGTGNFDLQSEVFYYRLPVSDSTTTAGMNFSTGATRIPVSASPVPTPTATPTPSPTPTVSPTPVTPPAVQGVSPGMLAILDYNPGTNQPVVARTAVGSLERQFTLPIELAGVTMTINGAACGLKAVGQRQITFVVPPGLFPAATGTVYPVVINNNGVTIKSNVTVVGARPDIFNKLMTLEPLGRAKAFNATNRVLTMEPFTIRTFRLRGSRLVPTVLRVYLTGVNEVASTNFIIRIGNTRITGTSVLTKATLVEPGIYTVDFTLPPELAGAGDQPLVISVVVNGVTYDSRLDDTTSRVFIL
ncbi:MAG TPA: hypothetical protein VGC97_22225 [Pyrinomonadaceae bacterium]